ncbi:tetratricopeptide repeat protein [Pontibacter sp. G13]|uniref:tetratricopeptide repeat protein n=1 Tax=Pontibacter sp. G13 TaxID=3074898 RepID=UPI00288B3729|nr:tetratricopeptide repeat protein [Pontibacter sp. G13]WNJ19457.1 tetratricopeptide repeat protein [Pontibacter sp. G13]
MAIFLRTKAQTQVMDPAVVQARDLFYQSYLENNPAGWEEAVSQLKMLYAESGYQDVQILQELAIAQYGLSGGCIANDCGGDKAGKLIDETEKTLDKLLKKRPTSGAGNGIMGGLLGLKMGLSPAKAIFLGPRAMKYLDIATKQDTLEPIGWVENGNMRFHSPSLFGGDKKAALRAYKKAVAQFEENPTRAANSWMYMHAYAWVGKSYEALEKWDDAVATYERILEIAPEFAWVRDELLPAAKLKQAE